MDDTGGYDCPLVTSDGMPPLRHPNGATDRRGVLKLYVPLQGTHATPPLPWPAPQSHRSPPIPMDPSPARGTSSAPFPARSARRVTPNTR